MKDIAPKTERTPNDNLSDSVTTHPAFAQIEANRITIGGGKLFLYGSDFNHHHAVTITITRSALHRGLSNDWHFQKEELISVVLSEARWAGFVSSMNGHSVPCTLQHVNRERVPGIASVENRQQQFDEEMRRRTTEARADLKRVMELHEKGGSKKEIRDLLRSIEAGIGPSIEFIAKQFGEHMEAVTEKAKTEVEAFAHSVITRTGIAALKGELPVSLPNKEKK